jgi:hypothetical protein
MSKHTPGPWHLFERNHLCIESASGNVALCNLARNNEADAKLIAAAPDMHELVKRIAEGGNVAMSEAAEIIRRTR